eukprot:TCONS_00011733-protein
MTRRKMGVAGLLDELARGNNVAQLEQILVENEHVNNNDNESKSTALHTAATKGFAEVVAALIRAGANVRLQNWKGLTPIHLAAHHGRLNVLKLLLSYDPTLLNMTDLTGNTLINIAAHKGHVSVVEYLLKETEIDFRLKNKHGNTSFHSATLGRRLKVLKVLLHYHPEAINETNKDGNTPLHLASERGYATIMQLLLSRGARGTKRNNRNKTPFHLSPLEGQKVFRKFENYKDILTKCSNDLAPLLITKRYEDDDTALHIAAFFETKFDVIRLLVQSGHSVNCYNCHNQTPLFVAVEMENTINARTLVTLGGRVDDVESTRGQTPLHVATFKDNVEMLKILTRRNSLDVNVVDQDGKTPLAYAIIRSSRVAVQHLLERGADTGMKDSKGNNALHLSVMTKNTEITEDVLSVGNQSLINEKTMEGKSPLLLAVDRQSKSFDTNTIKMIDILLNKGADPHQKSKSGSTAYELACTRGIDLDNRQDTPRETTI